MLNIGFSIFCSQTETCYKAKDYIIFFEEYNYFHTFNKTKILIN